MLNCRWTSCAHALARALGHTRTGAHAWAITLHQHTGAALPGMRPALHLEQNVQKLGTSLSAWPALCAAGMRCVSSLA